MKVTASYIIEGVYFGDVEIEYPVVAPCSKAFFCKTCGEIWARIVVNPPTVWFVENVPCKRHKPVDVQDWERKGGSVFPFSWSKENLASFEWAGAIEFLPNALLKREFQIHHDHFLEQQNASLLSPT